MDLNRLRARWPAIRQAVRSDELFVILLAVIAGGVVATGVIALRELVVLFHHYLYGVPAVEHALQGAVLTWWRPALVLGLGGVGYGLVALAIRCWRPADPLDVIEANALHGGNLPLGDGLIIAFLTVVRRILDMDILTINAAAKLEDLPQAFVTARQTLAFVQRDDGAFVGIVDSAEAQATLIEGKHGGLTAESLAHAQTHLLTPDDRLSTALGILESSEFEAVAVAKSQIDPRLVGCIHEADLLRCYVEEADRMRREELGEVGLFTDLAGRE